MNLKILKLESSIYTPVYQSVFAGMIDSGIEPRYAHQMIFNKGRPGFATNHPRLNQQLGVTFTHKEPKHEL